jgi:hypothetical protein
MCNYGGCMEGNIVLKKSFLFAIRIVKLCKILQNDKKEFVLSKQNNYFAVEQVLVQILKKQ